MSRAFCPLEGGGGGGADILAVRLTIPTVKHGGGSVMSGAALQLQDLDDFP